MELKFLGRGAAFNPKEGNNSAYFIENNQLFLIDCGESIFEKLVSTGLVDSVDTINLMITHTHSDHIGCLGTLAMYSYFTLQKPLNIIIKSDEKYLHDINKIISGFGITNVMFNFVDEQNLDNAYSTFKNIRYIETKHYDGLNCYSILFNTDNGIVFYSGDTKEMTQLKAIIESGEIIDKLYVDVSSSNFPGNPHLYIGILDEQISPELKSKTYCMHFNNDECIELAKSMGFNIVEVTKNNMIKIKK